MEINADFAKRVLVDTEQVAWVASPMQGVDRRMLDRIGEEVARATSIVRYAAGSKFSAHTHTGGEEFIVLDGVFQDEHGDYPVGSYVRNPPETSHTPGSDAGCVIFVKLWQFDLADRQSVRVNMALTEPVADKERSGVAVVPLFQDAFETVRFEHWEPNTKVGLDLPQGGEFLVIDGSASESGEALPKGAWLRLPQGAQLNAVAGPSGAKIWMKLGHLPYAKPPAV